MGEAIMSSGADDLVDGSVLTLSPPVACRYGQLLTIASDRIASESIRRYGEWAQRELDLIAALTQPGDWLVDGGAYIGTHTLAFSRFAGPSGRVISFEPRREVFRVLKANADANELDNVQLLDRALGEREGVLELRQLTSDEELANPGGQPIADAHDSPSAYSVTVSSLDALELERLDFLKLDVEGAEASVLAGGRQTIARHRPIVFAELNAIGPGADVLSAMQAHAGYRAFGAISPAFNPSHYRGDSENIFGDAVETALLFVPEEEVDRVDGLATSFCLTPVASHDELALVLLHKPQYPSEILGETTAGRRLGLSYPSPLAKRLIQEQAEAVEAVRAECEAHLAAAMQASEQAQRERIDALQQAHSKRVVALTSAHAEKLHAISRSAADKVAAANRDIEAARETLAQYERAISALHASTSWRLTAPLRQAVIMLRQALRYGRARP